MISRRHECDRAPGLHPPREISRKNDVAHKHGSNWPIRPPAWLVVQGIAVRTRAVSRVLRPDCGRAVSSEHEDPCTALCRTSPLLPVCGKSAIIPDGRVGTRFQETVRNPVTSLRQAQGE